jgi:hypothetical protein
VLPDTFLAVPRASGPVIKFRAPELIFDGTEAVRSRFHILRSASRFRLYRGRWGSISCFALLDTFWALSRASGTVFKFCAPELIFIGNEGVGARFQVLRFRTLFGRYRGRQVPFSCFALPDTFSRVSKPSGVDFMFCVLEFILGGIESVGSCFHVLRSPTRFLE